VFQIIRSEGLAGAWRFVQDMIGDLKTMVLDQIKTMVTEQVIRAGIEWLIGLLGGPAGAFIKAVQGIVRVVSWIIENGSRIAALVNAVLGSLEQIAAGNVGGAAAYIERTLAQALPLVISFLANLLGLGGISRKVQEIIERVKAPIDRAIQWIVQKATAMARRLLAAMRGRGRGRGGEGDGADDPQDVQAGLAAIDREEQRYNRSGEGLTRDEADRVAATVRHRHRVFTTLRVVDGGTTWNYEYALQRMSTKDGANKENPYKASRNASGNIVGDFAHFPDNGWGGYHFSATPHPANVNYGNQNGSTVPRPTGTYTISGKTVGNMHTNDWREKMEDEKATFKDQLQNIVHTTSGDAQAKKQAVLRYLRLTGWERKSLQQTIDDGAKLLVERTYNGMRWDDLYLVGWSEHHIHPVNWGGSHTVSNLQYLRDPEHTPITGWWNSKAAELERLVPRL
jgi:hypothetical protein